MPAAAPVIPEKITVHLGRPDQSAPNVTVSFSDYIKNVASSEIYPTWPENAIRANIYAQISFALNRVYTEHYPSRGYPFDITNSTAFDQYFVNGRDIFANISRITDEIFNSYVAKGSGIEPYFTQYCNGTTVTCEGLSQWGTVALAEKGYLPFQILQYYYGDNIRIVSDVPVAGIRQSYPGIPLQRGSVSNDVKNIQIRLNRISKNYPTIPKIYPVDGIFTVDTENAVRMFQEIFSLTPDGIVGKATWYRIQRIFNAVKRLSELNSEGLKLSEISTQFPEVLAVGAGGGDIQALQYFLSVIAAFNDRIPAVPITGFFGDMTKQSVIAFQKTYGLTPDGIVGVFTWDAIYDVYRGIADSLPPSALIGGELPFPGTFFVRGSSGDDVRLIQESLNILSSVWEDIPKVSPTGYFGTMTDASVRAFQTFAGLEPNGVVGPITWKELISEASDISGGSLRADFQYSGNFSQPEEEV